MSRRSPFGKGVKQAFAPSPPILTGAKSMKKKEMPKKGGKKK